MAKQFKVIFPSSEVMEFTARQYIDAKYAIIRWVQNYGYDGCTDKGLRTFLKDVEVSPKEYMEACDEGFDAWYAKN